MANPLVLLHGYSDSGDSYAVWKNALAGTDKSAIDIHIGNYVTLNNEVTIDDIAEGFDFALREKGLAGKPFDTLVHSTGMLVIRAWLTAPNANGRHIGLLKRLIALAPATFGSPLAAKGRSLLGRIFKGSWKLGPDFLNSGNQVLYDLELASSYTWNLAHRDLLGQKVYGTDNSTPYVFVFDGTSDYGKLAEIFDRKEQEGSDGTVRWAGCALNTRKIVLDLSVAGGQQVSWSAWSNIDIPLIPVSGYNHGEILRQPTGDLIDLVKLALQVDSQEDFVSLYATAETKNAVKLARAELANKRWQQFIVHARDSYGNPVTDFSVEVVAKKLDGTERSISAFEEDVHPYAADNSYRCFHVLLDDVYPVLSDRLIIRLVASTGTELMGYQGFAPDAAPDPAPIIGPVDLDVTKYDGVHSAAGAPQLFFPFTTTLIEIVLNRVPIPAPDNTIGIFGWWEGT